MASGNRKSSKRRFILSILIVLLVAAGLVSYSIYHYDSKKSKTIAHLSTSSQQKISSTPSSPSSQPTKSSSPSSVTSASTPGGVVDENGQSSGSLPPQSDWTTSSSGTITLQEPTANATLTSGQSLVGLAKVNKVNFALYDSSTGLIDQGGLNVVNGKFSGDMNFTAHASTGILQVFYSNPTNGAEEDMVEINVNFNN